MSCKKRVLDLVGITQESTTEFFKKKNGEYSEEARVIVDRIKSRINSGVNKCFEEHNHYHAIDKAWDIPFKQVTQTMLDDVMSGSPSFEEVEKKLKDLGLTMKIQENVDAKDIEASDMIPTFFRIFVPICKAYVTIRCAKIVNDRRGYPFMKFDPIKSTPKNRLRGEIASDRAEVMAAQFGYREVFRNIVWHTLHYASCIQFPMEEWYQEKSYRISGIDGLDDTVEKEGLRYHLPHPTRRYIDESYPGYTINTDTGVSYGGYWVIKRYGDLMAKKSEFVNIDEITYGKDLRDGSRGQSFFNTVYRNCTLNFPNTNKTGHPGELDRESKVGSYSSERDEDKAVLVTNHFEKIIPRDFGLGDIDMPVWFRFVVASDDTVIYAAPIPYSPMIYWGYDNQDNRSPNASMTMEILPFQDHFSNLMTQYILTTKQNLASLTFIDKTIVGPTVFDKVRNLGEKWFRGLNVFNMDTRKLATGGKTVEQAVKNFQFPYKDTSQILQAMNSTISFLERILVFSNQELGAAANHEQTAEEIRVIGSSTSNRMEYTANSIDDSMEAWKKQVLYAFINYGGIGPLASISKKYTKELLEELNISTVEDDDYSVGDEDKILVDIEDIDSDEKDNLIAEEYFSERGKDRVNDSALAQGMSQLLSVYMADPEIRQAIGVSQLIHMLNTIARMSGFSRDFKLNVVETPNQPQNNEELAQILSEFENSVLSKVDESMAGPIMEKVTELRRDIDQVVSAIGEVSQQSAEDGNNINPFS